MDAIALVKENGRLRKELATYQTELEAMEVRQRLTSEELRKFKKLMAKIAKSVKSAELLIEEEDAEVTA